MGLSPGYNNSTGRLRGSERGIDRMEGSLGPPPESDTLKGFRSFYDQQNTRQYTIASRTKYVSVSRCGKLP